MTSARGAAGRAAVACLVLGAGVLTAATSPAVATGETGATVGQGYSARITRASYGVPHITAGDFGSLGFGEGYVQAQDNLCVIADKVVTVNGQRSRYYGVQGTSDPNLASDLFFQQARDGGVVRRFLAGPQDGLHSPSREARDLFRGFVAGYNTYLRRTGVARLTDPACSGKAWVRPLTEDDLWLATWANMIRAGQRAEIEGIVSAAPPQPVATGTTAPTGTTATGPSHAVDLSALLAATGNGGIGSNAYGLGREATTDGAGMVLANPHFPWDGADRFYRMQLRIPGRYDVEGAALIGDPMIEIGHNATLAWSHTVSTAQRLVVRRLALVPDDPTAYVVDGVTERMTARTTTVTVTRPDGTTAPVSCTLYGTRFGPVVVLPGQLDWTASTAYALTDVNDTNNRAVDGWLQLGRARTVRDLKLVLDRHQFLPWVNVIAADATGEALYGDHSVVPHVDDALAAACIAAPFRPFYASSGVAVLDGDRRACDPGTDPDAAAPGILGPSRLPVRFRSDYVTNSNNSYWLANPAQPLEGFPRVLGDERTARSLRTRLGVLQVQQRLAGTDGLPGTRFTTDGLWQVMFGDRVLGGELVRDDLVALCTAHPDATASDGSHVDLAPACAALRAWDLHANLDSRGAHVFMEFANRGGIRFADPFSVTDPVQTPRRLAVTDPAVLTALADAVRSLAGIPLDAPLGAVQTEARGDSRIPIHGGRGGAGAFNVITAPLVPGVGYPSIVHGSSFVMAVELGPHGPSGRQILTYSQSADPTSPYFADQTRLYSAKGWDTVKYTDAQLAADPHAVTFTVHS